jgi:hypothetical protein
MFWLLLWTKEVHFCDVHTYGCGPSPSSFTGLSCIAMKLKAEGGLFMRFG